MTRPTAVLILTAVTTFCILGGSADGFDADQIFAKGTWMVSLEGGGGTVTNIENQDHPSDVQLWYLGVRGSLLPFHPFGNGFFHGALEIGLEPIYQRYTSPQDASYAGLALMGRYHFLSLGRFVPYVEIAGAAGGTNLKIAEIDSSFSFWTAAGVGASYLVTDTSAIYAGYRMVHISNGNTSIPNRGFEVSTGVFGVSFFLR